jgi:predicted nucleic acid-binding Zn ribbon protein
MPAYPYRCPCGYHGDVIKPIKDCDSPEPCPKCTALMAVDYSDKGWAKQGAVVFKGHFNASLGQYIGSKADIREAQSKIEDKTGSRPVEIGDQKPKYNPPKHDVDMREVLAYAEKLQTDRGETVNNG